MSSPFVRGLGDSVPIAAGYFPVGISFGIAAVHAGIAPLLAVAISMLIYGGAGQFILVSLLAAGGSSAWSIIAVVLMVNVRHLFYGPVIAGKLDPAKRRISAAWLAVGLTDEVFAASLSRLAKQPPAEREGWYVGLQLGAYASWATGTAAGAFFAVDIAEQAPILLEMFGFVLPALFFALLLELAHLTRPLVLGAAAGATLICLIFLPAYGALMAGIFAGAAVAARR